MGQSFTAIVSSQGTQIRKEQGTTITDHGCWLSLKVDVEELFSHYRPHLVLARPGILGAVDGTPVSGNP